MESHILNSYHQARYRTIGHKIMRVKSDSLSSEGSNQNSPEYAQIALQRASSIAQSEDSNGEDWCQSQTINTTQSSQDTSSDDESTDGQDDTEENLVIKEEKTDDEEDIDDNVVIQEINIDDSDENIDVDDDSVHEVTLPVRQNGFHLRDSNLEDNSLVEGHDYDVITVYEVNPDLDLIEASSDDDSNQTDFAVTEKTENIDEGEYLNPEDKSSYRPQSAPENGIDLNLDTPVVSNVDEYFIKDKDILEDDGPVVNDVDEYFIKDKGKKESTMAPNVDDFFIKHKLPEEESTAFHIPETLPNVDKFMVIGNNIKKERIKKVPTKEVTPEKLIPLEVKQEDVITEEVTPEVVPDEVVAEVESETKLDVSINESDLEVLPNIEDLKRYLLEEITYTKFKSIQKSCSLPHSPMHGSSMCMDVDDAKTCLSFEDLNLDLSDLAFDNDKDKSDNANKSDDIPRTLTDEDVNSFLITNKPEAKSVKNYDDLNPQEMEIDDTIESNITDIPMDDSFRKLTSTPLPTIIPISKVLDFCVEKTPSPSRKNLRKEKVTVFDSQATPKKVVAEPLRKTKIVPLNTKFNSNKVIDIKPVPIVKPVAVKPVMSVVKPIAVKPVAPKTVIAESKAAPADLDDFVDVESCNDTVIPVLEANNLSSLLEQFEATEKLNKTKKPMRIAPVEEQKKLNKTLTNGMRIQDAGVQLKNNKMRQILMPTTINTAVRRSPSPVHSDHDYCSSKKRHSLPNLKGGQSLLKPEVLSSNSRILSSRHRSCKNKKVVYNLSSDDESDKKETKNKKVISDSELKKKTSVKPAVKPPAQSNCRKKLSPTHSVNDVVLKSNSSVINKCASKASDTPCSQNSNGSIKLTIKNKSEVILNCDHKDSQIKHNDNVEKCKVSSSVSDVSNVNEIKQEKHIKHEENHVKDVGKHVKEEEKHIKEVEKNIKEVVRIKNKHINSVEAETISVKEETRPKEEKKDENFYTALFSNKQDVKIPHTVQIKKEINAFEEELNKADEIKKEEPHKRKKLNLQEYKLRRGASSNNSSTAVSPESIFPDMPHPLNSDKTAKPLILTLPSGLINKANDETPKKFYDPIREASRKIVAKVAKKQKAEALRKRDEDIVMSKIPKIDNLQLQPLISDAEMLKIVGMTQPEPAPPIIEKPQLPADYDEIILVSVGTNTDEDIFKKLIEAESKMIEKIKKKNEKSLSPPIDPKDPKARINFKINKSENVLKQNVFDVKKDKRHEDKKHAESKIDKERFKDITATLKSVGKQVDTKISSNSLFASIQDVVMKKAPEDEDQEDRRQSKPKSPAEKREVFKFGRATIVREYDVKADHGEDKIILHLGKQRSKPISANIIIQTDPVTENTEDKAKTIAKEKSSVNRRRNDSDMSMSSEGSPVRLKDKPKEDKVAKPKEVRPEKRSLSKDKQSRSKDRYETKYRRRSRSLSRSRRRRRTPTRSRSRSRGRFRRYRRSDRSDSPYKRKRRTRSRSRSFHKRRSPSRRSPSLRRNNRSRSRSRPRSKSPVAKKARPSPQSVDRKSVKSMTPPLRKPTISESSDSSSSSSSSSSSDSSSSSSASSGKSRRSCSPYKQEAYRKPSFRSFSSEDRENNTPVEERRIVFVGKLEKDITKTTLRGQFSKFGHVIEVRLHSKEDGTRYGFVTYQRPRDAWSAVEAASTFPQYDVGFGGRRAFCRQSYADLDGLEAKYTESAFHGAAAPPARRTEDMSFEQMLLEMKKKLSQRKNETQQNDP